MLFTHFCDQDQDFHYVTIKQAELVGVKQSSISMDIIDPEESDDYGVVDYHGATLVK